MLTEISNKQIRQRSLLALLSPWTIGPSMKKIITLENAEYHHTMSNRTNTISQVHKIQSIDTLRDICSFVNIKVT